MFSFEGVTTTSNPIIPVEGGTNYIFLKKAEYTKPEGKTPRLELHLERRVPGQAVENHVLTINDYTIQGARYDNQPKQELERYFSFLQTYNAGKTEAELIALVGKVDTWEELSNKIVSLLPDNYSELETTWFLRYNKGSDFLTIPNLPPFVKLGNSKFKVNPQYDFFTPQKVAVKPSTADEFSSVFSPTEATPLF